MIFGGANGWGSWGPCYVQRGQRPSKTENCLHGAPLVAAKCFQSVCKPRHEVCVRILRCNRNYIIWLTVTYLEFVVIGLSTYNLIGSPNQ